ncbi:hypothetical protein PMAYCL1PPCAC_00952, partial [Pristionchus mayeri]
VKKCLWDQHTFTIAIVFIMIYLLISISLLSTLNLSQSPPLCDGNAVLGCFESADCARSGLGAHFVCGDQDTNGFGCCRVTTTKYIEPELRVIDKCAGAKGHCSTLTVDMQVFAEMELSHFDDGFLVKARYPNRTINEVFLKTNSSGNIVRYENRGNITGGHLLAKIQTTKENVLSSGKIMVGSGVNYGREGMKPDWNNTIVHPSKGVSGSVAHNQTNLLSQLGCCTELTCAFNYIFPKEASDITFNFCF